MKLFLKLATPVLLFVTGCASQDQHPSSTADREVVASYDDSVQRVTALTITRKTVAGDSTAIDLQPSAELARAVELGQARPAGPVTDERYKHWQASAELRVQLEGEIGKRSHLVDLLNLAERSEDKFVGRFGIDVHPGESADRQLYMFQVIRERLQQELKKSDREIRRLETRVEQMAANDNHTLKRGDIVMAKPISELGLSEVQAAKLSQIGIADARDFALQFYLPQQHEPLAALLGVELDEAKRLVREAAKEVPEDELDELVREARRPHEFGILPPDLETRKD